MSDDSDVPLSGSDADLENAGINLPGFRRAIEYLQLVASRSAIEQLFHDVDEGTWVGGWWVGG